MSMELYVLSEQRLSSIAEWQQAIDAEGFALQLSDETPFDAVNGFLPMQLNGRLTGFECDHWDARQLTAELKPDVPDIESGQAWKNALAFRWLGSKLDEGVAAYMAATAYARATGGVIFDCEEGKLIGANRAKEIARDLERSGPLIEEVARRAIERLKSQS